MGGSKQEAEKRENKHTVIRTELPVQVEPSFALCKLSCMYTARSSWVASVPSAACSLHRTGGRGFQASY